MSTVAVPLCCKRCHSPRVTSWACPRVATVKDPVGWHCAQHSDAATKARQEHSLAKYALQNAKDNVRWVKLRHFAALFDIVAEVAVAHPNKRLQGQAKRIIAKIKKEFNGAAII